MPWIEYDKNNFLEWADHYEIGICERAISPTASDIYWALARKKELARQKDDDIFPKDIRRELAKLYRGFCHLIFYIAANPPGDCKPEMTKELSPYADMAWREFYCRSTS